jgi:hypothetical protein
MRLIRSTNFPSDASVAQPTPYQKRHSFFMSSLFQDRMIGPHQADGTSPVVFMRGFVRRDTDVDLSKRFSLLLTGVWLTSKPSGMSTVCKSEPLIPNYVELEHWIRFETGELQTQSRGTSNNRPETAVCCAVPLVDSDLVFILCRT